MVGMLGMFWDLDLEKGGGYLGGVGVAVIFFKSIVGEALTS